MISPAYNIASTGLYLNNGLYPREPLNRMAAPVQAVAQSLADAGYDVTPIAAWPVSRMSGPAGPIRSYSDSAEICTTDFCSAALRRALRIERAGRAAGYAYISTRGHVGPLAIAPDADAKAVVTTALCCALESGPSRVSMIVPSWADAVMQAVLALGFRIEEPYVLVASRPFGNWNNYLPGAPVLCSRQQMEREMESRPPSIVDLNAELAKLTMFRGRTPQSTMADRKGSAARLASYRDGALTITKFAGKGHWESHLTGDELIHVLDGTATLEIVCDDGPPKSFALRAGTMVVIPQGAWHRFLSSEGATLMTATPFPGEVIELDVDDPRTVERKP